jgi:hypothetical protein
MRTLRVALAIAATLLSRGAGAAESSLATRLDAATYAQVSTIIESAKLAHLPADPLVAIALEGASKHASGPRIVTAVRRHAAALGEARDALGAGSSEAELVAGAGALLAGVPRDSLASLRIARPGKSLVIPLVVLSDLVARSVPAPAASQAVLVATRAGARDEELMRLRERVESDIRAGAAPAEAAALRARGLVTASSRENSEAAPRPGSRIPHRSATP